MEPGAPDHDPPGSVRLIERFFAVLLEHYAGAFPAWLAPVTVGIPGRPTHRPGASWICCGPKGSRRSGHQRRPDALEDPYAQKQKVPFMLIAGDDDIAKEAVSFRYRNGEQRNGIPIAEAVAAEIVAAVAEKRELDGRRHCVEPAVDPHRIAYIKGEPTRPSGCLVTIAPSAASCPTTRRR